MPDLHNDNHNGAPLRTRIDRTTACVVGLDLLATPEAHEASRRMIDATLRMILVATAIEEADRLLPAAGEDTFYYAKDAH